MFHEETRLWNLSARIEYTAWNDINQPATYGCRSRWFGIQTITGNYYKSSHPIIGGLSRDSNYVKDLEKMEQLSPSLFGKAEGSQLRALKKAVNNTPEKPIDE